MKPNDVLAGLERLANAFSAPYQELEVSQALQGWLRELRIPFETDPFGNTIARVKKGMPKRTVVLATHLDRPALRVSEVGSSILASAEGPMPQQGLKNAKLSLPKAIDGPTDATIASTKKVADGEAPIFTLKIGGKAEVAVGEVLTFDLPTFQRKDKKSPTLEGKSIHDVAGVVALVGALADLVADGTATDTVALFTRGFYRGAAGAVAIAVDSHLPRDSFIVSVGGVPASDEVKRGAGPMIVLADGQGPLDPRATALLRGADESRREGSKSWVSQVGVTKNQLLASVFGAFGFSSAGVAIVTENFHNSGSKNPAPEKIHLGDLRGAIDLLSELGVRGSAGGDDLDHYRNRLIMESADGREVLREPIDPKTGYPTGARF